MTAKNTNTIVGEYDVKMQEYISQVTNHSFWIELTKCCGYGQFITVFREITLADLYKTVRQYMRAPVEQKMELYTLGVFGERVPIPNSRVICINSYIREYSSRFQPVYDVPAKVVYRIFYDDGHVHTHSPMDVSGIMQN